MPEIRISKLDAAARQLKSAVDLYFDFGDPVAILALAEASFEILRSLGKRAGARTTSLDQVLQAANGIGLENEVWKAYSRPKNFVKHADRDPDDTLDFNTERILFVLYESIQLYQDLTKNLPVEFVALRYWMFIRHPEIVDTQRREAVVSLASRYSERDRRTFLQDVRNFGKSGHGLFPF